jgi:hypothetical protein
VFKDFFLDVLAEAREAFICFLGVAIGIVCVFALAFVIAITGFRAAVAIRTAYLWITN